MSRITSVSRKGEGRSAIAARSSLAVLEGDQRLLGIGRGSCAAGVERVEIGHVAGVGQRSSADCGPSRSSPCCGRSPETTASGDRPRRVSSAFKRAHRRLLHDILGVGRALRQATWRACRRRRAAAARSRETAAAATSVVIAARPSRHESLDLIARAPSGKRSRRRGPALRPDGRTSSRRARWPADRSATCRASPRSRRYWPISARRNSRSRAATPPCGRKRRDGAGRRRSCRANGSPVQAS